MTDKILVIGCGGREHALAWKLAQSEKIEHIYVSPGNAGTVSTKKTSNIVLDVKNHEEVVTWCTSQNIQMVVVGPEDPLADGIADSLRKAGIKCFGPSKAAAVIEASKEFAKSFMNRHGIPTARWKSFTDAEEAKRHILRASYKAQVIKASGLADGKGVIIGPTKEEAIEAIDILKQDERFGSAADTIVIEELLRGEEVSVLCFTDGKSIHCMPPVQDHKRAFNCDKGPNTGGMGAYCPCPLVSWDLLKTIKRNILQKVVDGMQSEGIPFVGVLYAGIMLTDDGLKVLEFNCRFGDPEAQVLLPILESDLYTVMQACVTGSLNQTYVRWLYDKVAVGVILASWGYPRSYEKGKVIEGLDEASEKYLVFHASTKEEEGQILTSGGRVLCLVALATDLPTAVYDVQRGSKEIHFDGIFYRTDIAHRAISRFISSS